MGAFFPGRLWECRLTALQAAVLSGLNRNTVNRALRERILPACQVQGSLFEIIEIDESFFGARRVIRPARMQRRVATTAGRPDRMKDGEGFGRGRQRRDKTRMSSWFDRTRRNVLHCGHRRPSETQSVP